LCIKQASLNLDLLSKKTRKQTSLEEMEKVVPWADLEALIAPYYCEGGKGRPPFALQTMLPTHFMQQWFTLSDSAMEEAFVDTPLYRQFTQIEEFTRLPDESTILRFGKTPSPRHRLEKYKLSEQMLEAVNDILQAKGLLLKYGTVVDATLIAAPSSTKNKDHARDLEMHSSFERVFLISHISSSYLLKIEFKLRQKTTDRPLIKAAPFDATYPQIGIPVLD
jgi:transposase, IS5 family